jgi:SAM-dependent methyltransferase
VIAAEILSEEREATHDRSVLRDNRDLGGAPAEVKHEEPPLVLRCPEISGQGLDCRGATVGAMRRRLSRLLATYRSWASDRRYRAAIAQSLRGIHPRTCPLCDHYGYFRAFGQPPRYDAECPRCHSLERHRLFLLWSRTRPLVTSQSAVLHFAAEQSIKAVLSKQAGFYQTADLSEKGADLKLDIERIALRDASFDVVVASHVLEHVDDRKALGELRRILKPGGTLIVMIPIIEGWDDTYEDAGIVTSAEREIHFGQWNHVRFYGRDVRERIRQAGFALEEYAASGADCVKYGLLRGERIFLARKTTAAAPPA